MLAAGGCSSSARSGSPVLIGATWRANGQGIETLNMNMSGLVVPPAASRLELVFDRRLDGNKIEDGSQGVPHPRTNPPVKVAFAGKPIDYALSVVYASNGTGGPSIWASPQSPLAFPAGKILTFSIDRSNVTGTDGSPYSGPTSIDITTAPFSVDLLVPPTGTATPTTLVPLSFNNPPDPATVPHHARVLDHAGREISSNLFVDNRNRQLWDLQPACAAGWPTGQELTVVVDALVTDLYGAALTSEARATFSVAASEAGASTTGDCRPDGGGTDAGAAEADAADAGAADAGAAEDTTLADDADDGGNVDSSASGG